MTFPWYVMLYVFSTVGTQQQLPQLNILYTCHDLFTIFFNTEHTTVLSNNLKVEKNIKNEKGEGMALLH